VRRMSSTAAALLLCAPAILLTACGTTNPEPAPLSPPATTSPTPTTTTSPTPPPLPHTAKRTSTASAKAFVRHYFDVINYAIRTGKTAQVRRLGTQSCVSCQAIARNVEKVYGAGEQAKTRGWLLYFVGPVDPGPDQTRKVPLGVQETAVVLLDAHDEVLRRDQAKRQPMDIYVIRLADGWRVQRLDLVS
jgi:hypothetical protein